ncbi:MAG: Uma2 family endonuclease [Verrucomicrobiota bacterium]
MSTVLSPSLLHLAETNHHAFNLAVWDRLSQDSFLASLDYRIETDRHGQIVMSPLPAPSHGKKQSTIARLLGNQKHSGEVITECPISTSGGVKGAYVAWCSDDLWERLGDASCFTECPELAVEVVSPSNTKGEIEEKRLFYLQAGAKEVWICDEDGSIHVWTSRGEVESSALFPDFPPSISLV